MIHSPDRPILDPISPPSPNLPMVLNHAREELSGYYWFPDEVLSRLNYINGPRQTRSQRRAQQVIVIRTLLQYVDLCTLRIGVASPKGFIIFKNAFLTRNAGVESRSFKRCLADLVKAKYVSSILYSSKSSITGEFRGYAIRTIQTKLFTDLNISTADLLKARRNATSRAKRMAAANGMSLKHWNALPEPGL